HPVIGVQRFAVNKVGTRGGVGGTLLPPLPTRGPTRRRERPPPARGARGRCRTAGRLPGDPPRTHTAPCATRSERRPTRALPPTTPGSSARAGRRAGR